MVLKGLIQHHFEEEIALQKANHTLTPELCDSMATRSYDAEAMLSKVCLFGIHRSGGRAPQSQEHHNLMIILPRHSFMLCLLAFCQTEPTRLVDCSPLPPTYLSYKDGGGGYTVKYLNQGNMQARWHFLHIIPFVLHTLSLSYCSENRFLLRLRYGRTRELNPGLRTAKRTLKLLDQRACF